MGWDGMYEWQKPSDVRRYIENEWRKAENWNLLKTSSKAFGKRVWTLVENKDTNRREIILYLVDKMGGHYGRKPVHEDMGPVEFDCPKAILEAASEPNSEYSRDWREKAWAFHKASDRKFQVGDRVEIGRGRYYRIHEKRKRNSYVVKSELNGRLYRCNARRMQFVDGLAEARSIAKSK